MRYQLHRIGLLLAALLLVPVALAAQRFELTGRVTDSSGRAIAGATVAESGGRAARTDADGRFTLPVTNGTGLRVTAVGYRPASHTVRGRAPVSLSLVADVVSVGGLVVVGTRRQDRSVLETPAPVDVIPIARVASSSGQLDLNQLLQQVAPAFNANRQSGADGADHIDPASLRGLGPDQTLVLINGKRRHQSSLINIFGSRGRGNTGTDLNAIPVAAIERIEILRDGASAQYGSDAIAGVINIVLKSGTGLLAGSVASGFNNARPPADAAVLRPDRFDGFQTQASANYGVRLGEEGFLSLTGDFLDKGHTNRPVDPEVWSIYRRRFGDAALRAYNGFVNARYPLSERAAFYAFGGYGHRDTDAYAWTREPDSKRNVPAIYPAGFDPVIQSTIDDGSFSAGVAAQLGGWDVDLNNTFGLNRFHYRVDETLNASLGAGSPTHFDAGGFQLSENTTGLDLTRFFPGVASGLNLAFGAEVRLNNYEIFAGEEGSYRDYDPGDEVPGGSQGFPGFQPANELDESRSNVGAYVDAEVDLTPRFTLGGAGRYERYSDFGGTLNGKLSALFRASDAVSVRASGSTGFRAPSLPQIYFNSTFTDVVVGDAMDKIIARNDAPIARTLGIPPLREEKAVNFSAGFTARLGDFTATLDGYLVEVDDRIVITGAFEATDEDIAAELAAAGVEAVQFFTNALDTRTRGVDVVLDWNRQVGSHAMRGSLAGNFNDMELGAVRTSPRLAGKEEIYFGARERAFLLASAPSSKLTVALQHAFRGLQTDLRAVRYGRVVLLDFADSEDVYHPRVTVDLSFTYRLAPGLGLTVGSTNLFNRYPSEQDTDTETGGLWDAVQMGSNGAFYFARASFEM